MKQILLDIAILLFSSFLIGMGVFLLIILPVDEWWWGLAFCVGLRVWRICVERDDFWEKEWRGVKIKFLPSKKMFVAVKDRKKTFHCFNCGSQAVRIEAIDRYCCPKCLEWLENSCQDPECVFCSRPHSTPQKEIQKQSVREIEIDPPRDPIDVLRRPPTLSDLGFSEVDE